MLKYFVSCSFALLMLTAHSQAQPPKGDDCNRHGHHRGHRGGHRHGADRGERGERIEALRTAFITRHLDLTPTEAQQFWPLYNEFQTKEDSLENQINDAKFKRLETVSDKDLETMIESRFKAEEARTKLRREYFEKLKKVLPIRKIALLQRVERDFRRELVDMMRG